MNTITPAVIETELTDLQVIEKLIHFIVSQKGAEDPELQKEMEKFEANLLEIGNRLAGGEPWEYGFAFD